MTRMYIGIGLLLVIASTALLLVTRGEKAEPGFDVPFPVYSAGIRIHDGDTIRLTGEKVSIRLVGFNTPETSRLYAACDPEIDAGKRARTRLRELLASGELTLTYVRCTCRPGTEGTSACNHGRACGVLKLGDRNIGDILIAEGHAAPYHCAGTKCPKLPRPWCEEG